MREIVIVVTDLYWDPEAPPEAKLPALSGLALAARFGESSRVPLGWRDWLARWLGRPELAGEAPASIAAAGGAVPGGASVAWLATPVHLIASLTSLHLDRRGILRLPQGESEALAADFPSAFADSGFSLAALPSGDLLLLGSPTQVPGTTEPARVIGRALAQSLPTGEGAAVLRRLQAEIEMWLHGHPVNQFRAQRGEQPVNSLWTWGGGPLARDRELPAPPPGDVAFGADAYSCGLWRLHGGEHRPLPHTLTDVLGYAPAQRAAIMVEVSPMLQAHPTWTVIEALADLDRRFVAPAAAALRRGELASFKILANDRLVSVRSTDRRRWWRRARPALDGLLK